MECWSNAERHLCMRACKLCGSLLSLESLLNANENLDPMELVELWEHPLIQWICCDCHAIAVALEKGEEPTFRECATYEEFKNMKRKRAKVEAFFHSSSKKSILNS